MMFPGGDLLSLESCVVAESDPLQAILLVGATFYAFELFHQD